MPGPYAGPVPIATTQHSTQQGMVQTPSFVFLGASADVGIFKNCFGDLTPNPHPNPNPNPNIPPTSLNFCRQSKRLG